MGQHIPRKRFGQNFLKDDWVIARIADLIRPCQGDHLVEIGPGQGALTRPLLTYGVPLDVIELDRNLIPGLQRLAPEGTTTYQVHQQDALKLQLDHLKQPSPTLSLRIVGNLPYNISTPLLFHLLTQLRWIKDMHFMLQKEVVERMAAPPGSRSYGRLSVMVQHHCRIESLLDIGPESFHPIPRVNSALVRLIPHRPPSSIDPERLGRLVRQAFNQRRKTLRNTLKGMVDADNIRACGIDPTLRPEQIGLEGYRKLSEMLPDPDPA